MRSSSRFAVIALLAFGLAGVPQLHANASGSDASDYYGRLNAERTSHGLRALPWQSDLASVAYRWASHMSATQHLSHNPNLANDVSNWQSVGENVGDGPSIADLDRAFWASAPHRANILDSTYDGIGIGAVRDRSGQIWISVVFRDTLHSSAPVRVVSAPAHPWRAAAPSAAKPAAVRHHRPAVRPRPKPQVPVAPATKRLTAAEMARLLALETDAGTPRTPRALLARPAPDRPDAWGSALVGLALPMTSGLALRKVSG